MKTQLHPTRQQDDLLTIIGNTFRLMKQSWDAVKINLLPLLMLYLATPLLAMAAAILIFGVEFIEDGMRNPELIEYATATEMVAALGLLILTAILSIALLITQLASAKTKQKSLRESIDEAMKYFVPMAGLTLLSALLVTAGFVLFIIPGFVIIFFLIFAGYVLIDEEIGPVAAMKQSYSLVKSNWKVVVAFIFVNGIINFPGIIPIIGTFISTVLSILYLCLPAIIYLRLKSAQRIK